MHDDVLVEVEGGRFTSVTLATGFPALLGRRYGREASGIPGRPGIPTPTRIPGLTIPGLANCHSHAFHRALRGRTQRERGTFWTWRDQMYDVAGGSTRTATSTLARATYREMAAAGITTVGEFHYLHHQPDGTPYDDPNAMGLALVEAAREAGIRIALLDTCYLSSGFGEPPTGVAGAVLRRVARRPGPSRSQRRSPPRTTGRAWSSAPRSTPSARCPPTRCHRRRSLGPTSDDATAARPRLRAGRREPAPASRSTPAPRPRSSPTTACSARHHRRPRHPPHRRRHPAPRQHAHLRLLLPDHRARPRRRHRPQPPAARRRRAADPRQRQPRGDRPVRGDARGRARRAAGHPGARALDRGRAAGRRHAARATPASASTTRARSRSGSAPTWSRSTPTSPRTAGTGADENTAVFAATADDVTQVMVDGRIVVRQGDREQIGRELDAAIGAVWEGMS